LSKRQCPTCGEHSLSRRLLFAYAVFLYPPVTCASCGSDINFKRGEEGGLKGFVSMILSEWVLMACVIIGLLWFQSIWVGAGIFVMTRLVKVWLVYRGPLKGEIEPLNS